SPAAPSAWPRFLRDVSIAGIARSWSSSPAAISMRQSSHAHSPHRRLRCRVRCRGIPSHAPSNAKPIRSITVRPAVAAAPPYSALRLWAFCAGYFVFGCVSVPLFPVWLQARGLSEVEIANCVALPAIIRVLLSPVAGMLAGRAPNRRFAAITFTVPALLIFLLAWRAHGYLPILLITGASFTLWALAL